MYRSGHADGYEIGYELAAEATRLGIENRDRRIRELEQRLDLVKRYYEVDGDQVVQVGKYSHRWHGAEPLAVGDAVLLPENWVSRMSNGPGPTRAVVTELGSTYQGRLSLIIARADR